MSGLQLFLHTVMEEISSVVSGVPVLVTGENTAEATSAETMTVKAVDQPANDPVSVLIQKVDAVTSEAIEKLKGSQFTVKYYSVEKGEDMKEPKAPAGYEINEQVYICHIGIDKKAVRTTNPPIWENAEKE